MAAENVIGFLISGEHVNTFIKYNEVNDRK